MAFLLSDALEGLSDKTKRRVRREARGQEEFSGQDLKDLMARCGVEGFALPAPAAPRKRVQRAQVEDGVRVAKRKLDFGDAEYEEEEEDEEEEEEEEDSSNSAGPAAPHYRSDLSLINTLCRVHNTLSPSDPQYAAFLAGYIQHLLQPHLPLYEEPSYTVGARIHKLLGWRVSNDILKDVGKAAVKYHLQIYGCYPLHNGQSYVYPEAQAKETVDRAIKEIITEQKE